MAGLFEAGVVIVFVAVPFLLGFAIQRAAVLVLPGALLVFSVLRYVQDPPDNTDEIEVLKPLFVGFSTFSVLVCAGGLLAGRAWRRRAR